jgi:hypothetical protein
MTTERQPTRFVDVVTSEQGQAFADRWMEFSFDRGAITEACSEARIVEWHSEPNDDLLTYYANIENEIVQRVADQLRTTVVETFIRLANEVLSRERRQ